MITTLFTVLVLALAATGLYLLPILIGAARRVPGLGLVAVINILLGWTILGWVAALAVSLRSVIPTVPARQVGQSLPTPSPAPRPHPAAEWSAPAEPSPHHNDEPPSLYREC